MSDQNDKMNKMPEWSIFDRLDELESLTLNLMEKTDISEPTIKNIQQYIKDNRNIIKSILIMSLFNWAKLTTPSQIRSIKDIWLGLLKDRNLSRESYEVVENIMNNVCRSLEESEQT